jgi:hypothetical protein
MTEDNGHAGQGPVVLDIGGEVGAIVVTMPACLAGREVAIAPEGFGEPSGHVGVLARRTAAGETYAAVFGAVRSGRYQLSLLPNGPAALSLPVRGGVVTFADWPAIA